MIQLPSRAPLPRNPSREAAIGDKFLEMLIEHGFPTPALPGSGSRGLLSAVARPQPKTFYIIAG
jgi:fermentation-respiration switch protein FrsA (DUF1100 family)